MDASLQSRGAGEAEGKKKETLGLGPPEADALRRQVAEAHGRATVGTVWALESHDGEGGLRRVPIAPLPFRVGRDPKLELAVASVHVSKHHAEIYTDADGLRVRDLGSRNGTFVNRKPVADAPLCLGDVLHFGNAEYRVSLEEQTFADPQESAPTLVHKGPLPQCFGDGARDMRELLREGLVTMVFQPIVQVDTRHPAAYEALGRGRHPHLPEGPVELFEIAGQLGPDAQARLSRLFRRRAVELVRDRPEPPMLFLNTHPVELQRPGLLESLEELRAYAPQVDLVLEIHESALAQTEFMTWLRTRLMEINVGLAFDDFGAGQARLFELAESPPHYLKFDRRFVTGIDHAPTSRQRLVASLVAAARELLVTTVAEGVETEGEAAACVRAGFSHAQGFHYGRPAPVDNLADGSARPASRGRGPEAR
jgi:EAL domain-containing protein (putative c-di-GMP-specific phosphodiesterase class I)